MVSSNDRGVLRHSGQTCNLAGKRTVASTEEERSYQRPKKKERRGCVVVPAVGFVVPASSLLCACFLVEESSSELVRY